ncbi:amidase domain-containing protein [Kitasatospora mediocidica]|uniref:amidase domain-containing protein n=1 Tax=Kitasatospora mediocidica TaxID=58352 RepID=UPI000560B605|nr:amidase domain-containing protein [Kitasatospora mediocidica]
MSHAIRRRIAATGVVAGLLVGGVAGLAAPASAAAPVGIPAPVQFDPFGDALRAIEVNYAQNHWNWTAWNDSTPVAFGADQDNYQCAEFVARALAAAGLVPGLGPDDPQNDYFTYTAPNGKTYDLLLISDLPQYHNLYDYLMDSGLGTDVGDHPEQARPGDVVVTYAGPGVTKSHTGLVDTAATATAEPTVDAHNRARLQYGYHFYAPSHLVRIDPLGLLKGFAKGDTAAKPGSTPQPNLRKSSPSTIPYLGLHDPAGPQV